VSASPTTRGRGLPDRAQRLGDALIELGGVAAPGDVGRLAKISDHNTQARGFKDLEGRGLISRTLKRVELTPAGRDYFSPWDRPDAGALDEAVALWPYRHRAFLELLLSAVVARHLQGDDDVPPPNFMAVGATGTGKSAMAEAACHLLGLEAAAHTVFVPQETEGSIVGRRFKTPGGFSIDPAPATGLPFVFFDEFDKADEPVRRAVWRYFQGKPKTLIEGQLVPLRPVAMLAANVPNGAARLSRFNLEYRRRSVVLDTGTSRQPYTGLEAGLIDFYADERWRGLVDPDRLTLPACPTALLEFLGSVEHAMGDEEGVQPFCGARELASLARGRAAILGAAEVSLAAAAVTAFDYLACMESVGGVRPDWHPQLAVIQRAVEKDPHGGAEVITAALERRRQHVASAGAAAADTRKKREVEDLEHVGRRGELVERLKQCEKAINPTGLLVADRARAAGVRAQLTKLRKEAEHVQSPTRLGELAEAAVEPLATGHALRARYLDVKAAEAEDARQQRLYEQENRRRHPAAAAKRQQQQLRRDAAGQLRDVRTLAGCLERMWARSKTSKGENPLRQLTAVRLLDGTPLIVYRARSRTERRTFAEAIAGPGWWCSTTDPRVGVPGSPDRCDALMHWGQDTRAVIEPALRQLHTWEDRLLVHGGRARTMRLQLPSSSTKPATTMALVLPFPFGRRSTS
jgi:hypothetical protein